MTDNELALRAADGDQGAFETLIERHRARIYAIAYRVTLNAEDALDVTQNVFLHLSRGMASFEGRGSFAGWVAAITAKQAISHQRRASRREIPVAPEDLRILMDGRENGGGGHPAEALDLEQKRQLVEASLAELSPQQRAIFALRLGEGIGAKAIGERLGVPAKQVRSQFQRALQKLRQAVTRENGAKR